MKIEEAISAYSKGLNGLDRVIIGSRREIDKNAIINFFKWLDATGHQFLLRRDSEHFESNMD